MNERSPRRLSQAISEGDGISVLVEARDPEAGAGRRGAGCRRARRPGGRGRGCAPRRSCPCSGARASPTPADAAGADAFLLVTASYGEDWERLADAHERVLDLGLDCVVEVRDEEELQQTLEHVDPEIFLLAGESPDPDVDALDHVLELLPDVPAGKLAVAHLAAASRDEVSALERAGVDAVLVDARDVRALVGAEPPEV